MRFTPARAAARPKFAGRAPVAIREVRPARHRVHQVVRGVHARQGALERGFVQAVTGHDFGRRAQLNRGANHLSRDIARAGRPLRAFEGGDRLRIPLPR